MPNVYTPESLADRWGSTPGRIRQLIQKGDVNGFKIGKLVRITEAEVERYESRDTTFEARPCSVYVVRSSGFVKIGKASDVERRIASLRGSNPMEVTVLAILTEGDGHKLERDLHRRFATCRHRHEWFREEGDLAAWIEAGCPL